MLVVAVQQTCQQRQCCSAASSLTTPLACCVVCAALPISDFTTHSRRAHAQPSARRPASQHMHTASMHGRVGMPAHKVGCPPRLVVHATARPCPRSQTASAPPIAHMPTASSKAPCIAAPLPAARPWCSSASALVCASRSHMTAHLAKCCATAAAALCAGPGQWLPRSSQQPAASGCPAAARRGGPRHQAQSRLQVCECGGTWRRTVQPTSRADTCTDRQCTQDKTMQRWVRDDRYADAVANMDDAMTIVTPKTGGGGERCASGSGA